MLLVQRVQLCLRACAMRHVLVTDESIWSAVLPWLSVKACRSVVMMLCIGLMGTDRCCARESGETSAKYLIEIRPGMRANVLAAASETVSSCDAPLMCTGFFCVMQMDAGDGQA